MQFLKYVNLRDFVILISNYSMSNDSINVLTIKSCYYDDF